MSTPSRLPFGDDPPAPAGNAPADQPARDAAVDPRRNVVLEASAGTGKTRVLVDRYVRLVAAGVDPGNILAMTFTRKAAAEMRQRIVARLRDRDREATGGPQAARRTADRPGDVTISTIDAFCLSLLHEFPLEADVDPGFDVADEAAMPRLIDDALDRSLRIARARARSDEDVALLLSYLGEVRLRQGLAALLERRLVAADVLGRVLTSIPRGLTVASACAQGSRRLRDALASVDGGLERFLDRGPIGDPRFALLAAELRALAAGGPGPAVLDDGIRLRATIARLQAHLFTRAGTARKRDTVYRATDYPGTEARRAHWAAAAGIAPAIGDAIRALRRDLNAVLSRAVWKVFGVTADQYRRTLEAHGVLDFVGLLASARAMLDGLPEFGRSRYLLESRYQHVLLDEFQDTSRVQWELVRLLVRSWGEGLGLAEDAPLPPSIFVVGDRKQSIYGFRDAEVALFGEAAAFVASLRPDGGVSRSLRHSFRALPALLAFANDLFADVRQEPDRRDAFRYEEADRFPVGTGSDIPAADEVLGLAVGATVRDAARAIGAEIARLLGGALIRDRLTGIRRPAAPGDIAILFRTRESHREFELDLEARGIPAYVYKGLGFFDAPEIIDVVSLVRFLADPASDLRAAALLRSRIVRLSDAGLQRLAPALARALTSPEPPAAAAALDPEDRQALDLARDGLSSWLPLADRLPPAELLDRVLHDTAYAAELGGPRLHQARENVKKLRTTVRRLQNRGYLTLGRLVRQLERMSVGDESNAVVDALDAVNLMTIHAAKGLEFPVVFVVNLSKGTGGAAPPIRVVQGEETDDAVTVGDFRAEADDDRADRDREETKRLLYVAVTRARDRLYLSTVLDEGRFVPRRGSLGEVLPGSVRDLFEAAGREAGGRPPVEWRSSGGRPHPFRLCPPAGAAPSADTPAATMHEPRPGPTAQATWPSAPAVDRDAMIRTSVTAVVGDMDPPAAGRPGSAHRDAQVAGRLVHRLFQRAGPVAPPAGEAEGLARALLTEEERLGVADEDGVVREAAETFTAMRRLPDVQAALSAPACHTEVPFTLRLDGRTLVRGAIDCVAVQRNGDVLLLDFKTGGPRPADAAQLALYERAARALFPGARIEAKLIYPPPGS